MTDEIGMCSENYLNFIVTIQNNAHIFLQQILIDNLFQYNIYIYLILMLFEYSLDRIYNHLLQHYNIDDIHCC